MIPVSFVAPVDFWSEGTGVIRYRETFSNLSDFAPPRGPSEKPAIVQALRNSNYLFLPQPSEKPSLP